MIIDSSQIHHSIREKADVCIVGSGSAGAILAYRLQKSGAKVIVLEEGGYYTDKDFTSDVPKTFHNLYKNRGVMAAFGKPTIPIAQGRCVGGSSVVNTGTCLRTPRVVLEDWEKNHGVEGMLWEDLLPYLEEIEGVLGVRPLSEAVVGRNNLILRPGVQKLGWKGGLLPKNAPNCIGCNRCNLGCPVNAKKAMHITYIPMASERGAKIYADLRVEKILTRNGRAVGVRGSVLDRATWKRLHEFEVQADRVVLSAGALGSPILLQKNRLANGNGQVGKNLHIQPSAVGVGLYGERIEGWKGNPQGYGIDQFGEEGITLEAGFAPLEALVPPIPLKGVEHKEWVAKVAQWAVYGVVIKDRSSGSVRWLPGWKPLVFYDIDPMDAKRLIDGLKYLARVYFSSGAQEVALFIRDFPILRSMEEIESVFDSHPVRKEDLRLSAYHPMGTCRMGGDRRQAVVDSRGETYDVEKLYVCDASLFPTALGVNPQMTVMAVASLIADRMVEEG